MIDGRYYSCQAKKIHHEDGKAILIQEQPNGVMRQEKQKKAKRATEAKAAEPFVFFALFAFFASASLAEKE
jgi:hypothetical protein